MVRKQIKTKERVQNHGEVFTNEREVKAMCDMVDHETKRIDSRFLEPACGDGNFLAEILTRKLKIVKDKYKKSFIDYEKQSIIAISSLYGVDILIDNVVSCRERLYKIWDKQYKSIFKDECNDDTRKAVNFILSKNIVCGNALTLKQVDDKGVDLESPIIFSEWGFVTGMMISRKDYTFDELLNGDKNKSLLNDEGKFLEQYTCSYRRLSENE